MIIPSLFLQVTLHTEGCRDTLMGFFAALLKNSAGIILLIGLFQVTVVYTEI